MDATAEDRALHAAGECRASECPLCLAMPREEMAERRGHAADRLYWDKAGTVTCGAHAPPASDPAWAAAEWQEVPQREARGERCVVCGWPVVA